MFQRRLLTLSSLVLATILAIALLPLVVITALLMSLSPKFRTAPQALTFIYGFLVHEWAGLARFLFVLTRYPKNQQMEKNRDIQFWWAQQLFDMGKRLYKLRIEVTGTEALEGNCALLLSRHSSMGDTVLPLLFFGKARAEGLRYVLKQELRYLPCLDIGGHRLPNVFVDRSGTDSAKAIQEVSDLIATAGDDESVLIYPEGTRFTQKKHDDLRRRHPQLENQLNRWPNLLPPRLGGVLGMLKANPGKDLVFLAHAGFEGSADIHDLLGGGWLNQKVRLHFWRVPYSEIQTENVQDFLFAEWDKMQATVVHLLQEIDAAA
ncbi:MAG: lysophospholipid acyltransferase family protein [Pseudomonadales bacterium]|nr:lysophospholipid acyltransferase family protein [Pseudomonadales bacterium]